MTPAAKSIGSARTPARARPVERPGSINVCMRDVPEDQVLEAEKIATSIPEVASVRIDKRGQNHNHIVVKGPQTLDFASLAEKLYRDFPH